MELGPPDCLDSNLSKLRRLQELLVMHWRLRRRHATIAEDCVLVEHSEGSPVSPELRGDLRLNPIVLSDFTEGEKWISPKTICNQLYRHARGVLVVQKGVLPLVLRQSECLGADK